MLFLFLSRDNFPLHVEHFCKHGWRSGDYSFFLYNLKWVLHFPDHLALWSHFCALRWREGLEHIQHHPNILKCFIDGVNPWISWCGDSCKLDDGLNCNRWLACKMACPQAEGGKLHWRSNGLAICWSLLMADSASPFWVWTCGKSFLHTVFCNYKYLFHFFFLNAFLNQTKKWFIVINYGGIIYSTVQNTRIKFIISNPL